MALPDLQPAFDAVEQGHPADAVAHLEALTQALPAYPAAHVLLARAYADAGRWRDAVGAWRRARFWLPRNAVVRDGLREAFARLEAAPAMPAPAEPEQAAETPPPAEPPAAPGPAADPEPPADPEPSAAAPETADVGWETVEPDAGDRISGRLSGLDEFDDLDRLIESLEGARIQPQPDLDAPEPELDDDIDDMVSETLARIYAVQEQFEEAARVYEQLARQHPGRADEFQAKAAEMREKA